MNSKTDSLSTIEAAAKKFSPNHPQWTDETLDIAVEDMVTIDIDGVGRYSLLCNPIGEKALAVGFAFSEGWIETLDDVASIERCQQDTTVIKLTLSDPDENVPPTRNMLVTSACGACGDQTQRKDLLSKLSSVKEQLSVDPRWIHRCQANMRDQQHLFLATGATHAAALFDQEGNMLAMAEDIGRHNALDRAIGTCLLTGISTTGLGAMLSGRISFELVAKCARAGIELMAAVSAPTSMAIEAASLSNITLLGFVRDGRATVYTHPQRVEPRTSRP